MQAEMQGLEASNASRNVVQIKFFKEGNGFTGGHLLEDGRIILFDFKLPGKTNKLFGAGFNLREEVYF